MAFIWDSILYEASGVRTAFCVPTVESMICAFCDSTSCCLLLSWVWEYHPVHFVEGLWGRAPFCIVDCFSLFHILMWYVFAVSCKNYLNVISPCVNFLFQMGPNSPVSLSLCHAVSYLFMRLLCAYVILDPDSSYKWFSIYICCACLF